MWSIAVTAQRFFGKRGGFQWLCVCVGVLALATRPAAARAQLAPQLVYHVRFHGNHAIESDVLAASIQTTQSGWFRRTGVVRWMGLGEKRTFNPTAVAADSARLLVAYRRSGYPDVRVSTSVSHGKGGVDVTFNIVEGPPVYLSTFDIFGLDSVENAFRIRQDLPIAAGDVASDYRLHEAVDTIQQRLRNRGYPAAVVRLDEQLGHASQSAARLQVTTGHYARFGSIRVSAPPEVDTVFASRLVAARPGNEYRANELIRSQRSLYVSDLFRLAAVNIDTARLARTDSALSIDEQLRRDSVIPVGVMVYPNFGHRAKASVGYGTDDCLRTGAGWTARNFPVSGLVFDVTGQLSKIGVGDPLRFGLEKNVCAELKNDSIGSSKANYSLNASLRRNAFLSPNNSVTFSVFAAQRSEFEVYLRREVGASVSITRNTAANVPITLAYRIADGVTQATPASFCAFFNTCDPAAIAVLQQRRVQATLTISAVRQRLNNPLDPLRGSLLSGSITTSSHLLGSSPTQQFTRMIGDAAGFLPLSRSIVLVGHLRGGVILAPRINVAGDSGNFVPPDQRFYAGGSNDVRGYDQNELGPLVYVVPIDSIQGGTVPVSATRVAPTGGTRVAIGNLELRLPTPLLAGKLRVALFVDAGALWTGGEATPLRVTPGAGLRYSSPLGPIRFDVGYNRYDLQPGPLFAISSAGTLERLNDQFSRPSTRHFTLHFSIGQPFP